MDQNTRTILDSLYSDDGDSRSKAMDDILVMTDQPVDWAYAVWDEVLNNLRHKNNHQRAIAAQLLANLAKSDAEQRIMRDFEALWAVTYDEKFVTARHTLQSIWKVGLAGPMQRQLVVNRLADRFRDCVTERNWTLIRYDIIEDFKKMYDAVPDETIKVTALALIETEEDLKYRKKYASVWRRR